MLSNNGRCVMEICAAPGCKTWVRSLAGKGHLPTSLLAAVCRGEEGRDSWGRDFLPGSGGSPRSCLHSMEG